MLTMNERTKADRRRIAELKEIPVPTVESFAERKVEPGDRWMPIQHGEFVEEIHRAGEERGLIVQSEDWFTNKSNMRLWGSLTFRVERGDLSVPEGMTLALGAEHANDMSKSARFYSGARIFVCENGMIVGEAILLKRKHTSGFVLSEVVDEALDRYVGSVRDFPRFIEALKNRDLSCQQEVDHLLMEAVRRDVIPANKVKQVDKEWREPRHPEFADRNGWGLYNAFTQVAKDLGVNRQMKALDGAREIVLPRSYYTSKEVEVEVLAEANDGESTRRSMILDGEGRGFEMN